ncbi:MAG: hypothetical protein K8F30_12000, partial [Taibaiella sp.]|nr:hypothetical protein [Taibaiella sp.]
MKYLLPLILSVLACGFAYAQPNLVPNGSFEQYSTCPTGLGSGQFHTHCVGWGRLNMASPDYMHSCGSGVPNNAFGHQWPAQGQAYCGIVDYAGGNNTFREYITAYITPMQIGATYEVSLSVSVGSRPKYFTNGIGVHFFDTGITQYTHSNHVPLTPKINFLSNGLITDTTNWIRLS